MTKPLHFWYEFASPYACLAALRVEDLAKTKGVEVTWHPFLLGAIYKMMNMPTPPMQLTPQKEAYMWMDAKRQAKKYGISCVPPSKFPRVAVLPARVALLGREAGWCPEFSRRIFLANFTKDQEINEPSVVGAILEDIGLDPEETIKKAESPENKLALRQETQKAYDLGIFGVPTWFVGSEVFWGNDRLEEALDLAVS